MKKTLIKVIIKQVIAALLILSVAMFSFQCASNKPDIGNFDGKDNYEKGLKLLKKKRYLRAQEELNQAVISGAHTEWGDTAAFYLSEAYYLNKEYLLAISEYERMIRRMPFTTFMERARYRICECYQAESPVYYHDQTYTLKAIDEIQEFLDDFPDSEFRADALAMNRQLREKLGRKAYETGILYLKMDEPEPARMAFQEVVNNYYDTNYNELAHLEIVHSFCINNDVESAQTYLEEEFSVFKSETIRKKAENYIADTKKTIQKRAK
ncbi:MAG: outer membrane protein assembly factor BamD [Candidatus Marinimicrobia bacterium]|nr:outer membrane protein assembly factor BamD [Candidatus Neomarinimicrobiota bacterium]